MGPPSGTLHERRAPRRPPPSPSCAAPPCPRTLVERAAELGYDALALVDRDGLTGAPRFFKAAKSAGIRPLVGAELTLAGGGCLPLLVESRAGYQNLCRLITAMKAGRGQGRGRARPGRARRGRADRRAWSRWPAWTRSARRPTPTRLAPLLRVFGAAQRGRSTSSATAGAAQEAANQALLDLADALRPHRGGHQRRAPRARAADARCSTSSPASARSGRWPTAGPPAGRERRAPPASRRAQMAALFRDRPQLLRERRGAGRAPAVHARRPRLQLPATTRCRRARPMHSLPAPADREGRARPLPALPREGAPADRARAGPHRRSWSWPATS